MVGKQRPGKKAKHAPLAEDIDHDRYASLRQAQNAEDGTSEPKWMKEAISKKIVEVARRNRAEGEGDDAFDDEAEDGVEAPLQEGEDYVVDEEDEEVELEYDDQESQASEMPTFGDLDQEFDIDDEESRLLNKFQPATTMQTRNLADIIMAKIKEQAPAKGAGGDGESMMGDEEKIDKRVAKIYSAIGGVLKSYTAGKIPKAFKVLPHIRNWEQLLLLTRPHDWSPHATYSATRIFASALNERMAQRFYSAILLPIVHTTIEKDKKLHPAMYQAVRKALFKPIAFFKGFLLPLVTESEFECTLKEALIIGSVLQKCHLPPIPAAVSLVKMCEVPFSSAQCVFLRIFIDKKMTLPYQCIDALVLYFHRFCQSHTSSDILPVLWHQTFLLFVTYYKLSFTEPQMELLKAVCSKHFHAQITPEVRREIAAAQGKKSQYH